MAEKKVTVLIYGSGANAFVPKTDGFVYLRTKDCTRFLFSVRIFNGDNQEPVDIALALVDASHEVDDSELSADLKLVQRANSRTSYIMFMDPPAATGDNPEFHLWYLLRRARLSARYDLDCLPTDADIDTSRGLTCFLDTLAAIVHPVAHGPSWSDITMRAQNILLDTFAYYLSLPPCKESLPEVEDELAIIQNDEHIWELADSALGRDWESDIKACLPEDIRDISSFPAHRITPSLIAKNPTASERESMEFVRRYTTIPVPRTHRPDLGWLIMDFIDGDTLLSCWRKLSWFKQLRVACTLRLYVRQLRAMRRAQPGNIVNGRVSGLFFQQDTSSKEFGPYDSPDTLRRFCTYVAYRGWDSLLRLEDEEVEPPPSPAFDWSPMFVHGDLNMSNIILDHRGTVWLVDWAWAGYYPACLESLAMRHSNDFALRDVVPASWARYRSFIAGPTSSGIEKFWYHVLASIHRF